MPGSTVAELKSLYRKYESALVNNDAEILTSMFWASPQSLRFGVTENLYGIDQIAAFRGARPHSHRAGRRRAGE